MKKIWEWLRRRTVEVRLAKDEKVTEEVLRDRLSAVVNAETVEALHVAIDGMYVEELNSAMELSGDPTVSDAVVRQALARAARTLEIKARLVELQRPKPKKI